VESKLAGFRGPASTGVKGEDDASSKWVFLFGQSGKLTLETIKRVQIPLRIVGDDNAVLTDDEIIRLDKNDDILEAIGRSLDEAKTLRAGIQERLAAAR